MVESNGEAERRERTSVRHYFALCVLPVYIAIQLPHSGSFIIHNIIGVSVSHLCQRHKYKFYTFLLDTLCSCFYLLFMEELG